LLAKPAFAYDLSWNTVDGGGKRSTGGNYTLEGTIGQHDAGTVNGGSYQLQGGFWKTHSSTPIPSVELSVSASTGTEAATTAITVTATASSAVTGDQTVNVAASGTGITSSDYTLNGTTLTILDGQTTGTATFTIVDDSEVEGTETATLTISSPSAGITLGSTTTQNVSITDNDFAQPPPT